MKVEIKNAAEKEKTFPRLMWNPKTGTIILALKIEASGIVGTILNDATDLGTYGEFWAKSNFVDYNGTITLSND